MHWNRIYIVDVLFVNPSREQIHVIVTVMSLARPFSPKKSNENTERNKENWTPKRLVFSQKPEAVKQQNSPSMNSIHNKENTPNRLNAAARNAPLSHQKQVSNTYTRSTLSPNVPTSGSIKSPSKKSPAKAKQLALSPLKASPSKGLKAKHNQPTPFAVFTWLPFAVKFLTYEKKAKAKEQLDTDKSMFVANCSMTHL